MAKKTAKKAAGVTLTRDEAVALLKQLNWAKADAWETAKIEQVLNGVGEMEDLDDLMKDADADVAAHCEAVMEALGDGQGVTVVEDETNEDDVDAGAEEDGDDPDDIEGDNDESVEEEDDDEVEEAPKKVKGKKPAPAAKKADPKAKGKPVKAVAPPPSKNGKAKAPAAAPAKPEKKKADRSAPGTADVLPLPAYKPGETDVWGSRFGTRTSRVNMLLLKGKPMGGKEIAEALEEKALGSHFSRLQRNGKIARVNGKYELTKQGQKDKLKQDADKPAKGGKPAAKPAPAAAKKVEPAKKAGKEVVKPGKPAAGKAGKK